MSHLNIVGILEKEHIDYSRLRSFDTETWVIIGIMVVFLILMIHLVSVQPKAVVQKKAPDKRKKRPVEATVAAQKNA